jgi:hypothetical protein
LAGDYFSSNGFIEGDKRRREALHRDLKINPESAENRARMIKLETQHEE